MSNAQMALAGWPLAGFLGLLLIVERFRAGRKKVALNRAVHELRRPLQLLALRPPPGLGSPNPLQLSMAALSRLESEINGEAANERRLVSAHELAGGAVGRWRPRARHSGGSLALRWRAGRAPILGDPVLISQALDNLIANALEHGGPNITVEARSAAGRLRISVVDDGRAASPGKEPGSWSEFLSRRGASRGHGLEVVHSVATAHRGRFALRRSESGSVATLELPLASMGDALAA
jgi:signal transduction histidine kinase